MKKVVRLNEGQLNRIIKESVKNVLRETRLDYDEDNFSGRYNRYTDNDDEWYGEEVYALNIDDIRDCIYKLGRMPITELWLCQSQAERYGRGGERVESYKTEKEYINAINDYLKKGYCLTN
jgi:hypothetical protein